MNWAAVSYALASAFLFGVSAPAAKLLLGSIIRSFSRVSCTLVRVPGLH